MNPRTIRRAAERQAAKLARKAQPNATSAVTETSSPAQIAANQLNSQLSTGPKTTAGQLVSSKNALKTGLTGRTVLLPTDDVAAYESLLAAYLNDYNPTTPEERDLTQSLVDCTWRMKRIMNLEFGIYTKGSIEFADDFPDLEPAARNQMIQVETYLKYEKSIRNLNTQEARLQRRLVKDALELRRLQYERQQRESDVAAFLAARAKKGTQPAAPPAPPEIGFVFSNAEIPAESAPAADQESSTSVDLAFNS